MMSALLDSGRLPGFPMRRFCSAGLGRRPDPLPPTAAPPTKQVFMRRRESDSADVGALSRLWKTARLCGRSGSMAVADGHSSIIPIAAARWVPFNTIQHHSGWMMVAGVQRQPLGIIRHHLGCMIIAGAWCSRRRSYPARRLSLLRLMLHDRCAPRSSDAGFPATTWSACHGSSGRAPPPQIQQTTVFALTSAARRW